MDRYTILGQVGDGSFGVVSKARHTNTDEIVAIKKMKQTFHSWEECLQLHEVQSLRKIHHPNVLKLKQVIREKNELFLVFQFCQRNIFQITRQRVAEMRCKNIFNERQIRSIMCQTLLGVQAIHKNGFMHRDLKPENLLVKGDVVKVADFGLAKQIRSRPPFTQYVSTRWYRAPQLVLHSRNYNSPVDIWACGVIFAELLLCRPLFPGSSDSDQLFKICSVIGSPTSVEWDEGHQLARRLNVRFPAVMPTPLRHVLHDAPSTAVSLIQQMLRFNPNDRLTAVQCLQHPYFTEAAHNGLALYAGISTGQPHNPFQLTCQSHNINSSHQHLSLCNDTHDQSGRGNINKLVQTHNSSKRGSGSSLSSMPSMLNGSSPNTSGVIKYANLFVTNTNNGDRRNSNTPTSHHSNVNMTLTNNTSCELQSCDNLHSTNQIQSKYAGRSANSNANGKVSDISIQNNIIQENDDIFNF